ncbi:MAG: VWA domain-containing protein [Acidobacteria bacterium]|nr:VWA domain-containing protein [Acidobacteriota bacterium]
MVAIKMRSTIYAAFVGITAAALLTTSAGAQKIRTSTQTVPIYATVTDDERRLVPDLEQQDFEVYDNGKLQVLTNFDNNPTPFTGVVMLDTSGSMTLALDLVKQAAEQFLLRMLPEDRAMVGAFNDKIEFEPDTGVTANRDQLIRALKDLDFGYPTRLYDAVDQSIFRLREAEGRKVVVVFTDGDDTASKVGMGDALERARIEDVMVYAIGLQSEYFNGQQRVRSRPDRGLKKLAEETGGGYFELKKTDELGPTFTRVAQELHSQYVLGFSPQALDGKVHKVETKVKKPGMTARARKSYVAAPAGTQTEK